MKERIAELMRRENLSPSVFAESIGIQRSALSHILNGRNNPSLEVVLKIHQAYKHINLEWLLKGEGEMLKQESRKEGVQPSLFDLSANTATVIADYTSGPDVNAVKEIVKEEIRYIEKPQRKITEIRIFFDDNTFEIFRGEK